MIATRLARHQAQTGVLIRALDFDNVPGANCPHGR